MPGALRRLFASPDATASESWSGVMSERTASADLGPTPDTPISIWKAVRSAWV